MADNFENRGYEDYFKALEQQLNKPEKPCDTVAPPSTAEPHKKSGGIYKVIRLRKSVVAVTLAIVIAAVTLTAVLLGGKDKTKPQTPPKTDIVEEKVEKIPKPSFKETAETVEIPASNDAATAIIIRKSDNSIVAARDIHKRVYPASTVKIMTLLVAVEKLAGSDKTFTMTLDITDPLYVAGASVAQFARDEVISVTDLLYGTILPSGADAAMGLAILAADSEAGFVKLMNEKAEELGLKNTHFTNATGLFDEQNYSSAYDMAIIIDAAMKNPLCREVLSTYQHTTAITPQHPEGILLSSTLFSHMYGNEPETATILGGKTGFVNESGYCIASFGEANETKEEYIVVTFGNSSRWPAFHGQIDLYKQFAK